VTHEFLGLIAFREALRRQEHHLHYVSQNSDGVILGFECEPVITLGVRASESDLEASPEALNARGFSVERVDRGGQATVHNPGQLVIFPIVCVRDLGARHWVNFLLRVTRLTLRSFGCESECREGQPGLYTSRGKVASIGVRFRQGVSTHGVAINVHNELSDFGFIRACGIRRAPVDQLGGSFRLEEVFSRWLEIFSKELPPELTKLSNLQNLEPSRARL
jgi:lipoate-protein ligase B